MTKILLFQMFRNPGSWLRQVPGSTDTNGVGDGKSGECGRNLKFRQEALPQKFGPIISEF